MTIKTGENVYILQDYPNFRLYQVIATLVEIKRVPVYPCGHANLYVATMGDGCLVGTYRDMDRGSTKRRAIRKTPHPGVPLYRSRAEVDKGAEGINLACIKDDCPRGGDMVDARKCERCEYHNHRKDGVGEMNCTHPGAESHPNDARWEALKSAAGMLHVTMASSAPDVCERCRSLGNHTPATQTISMTWDNRPRRYCDSCAEAGRKLGWIHRASVK